MSENLSPKEQLDTKRAEMLSQPVERLICKLAVPTIVSMLVTSLYNLADTYFVGQLDSDAATGAVGVVFSLMAIIQACGFFFGQGSGNYISRVLGRKEYEKAAKMAATGFFSALIIGVLLASVGLCFQLPMARLLGATETMLTETRDYLRYILIGMPYMMAALVLNVQLRLQGNSFFSMLGLLSGALVNIVLDPILIFTLEMGVSGAALSTIIGQFISFIILFLGCQKSSSVTIYWHNFSPNKKNYLEILGGGLPSLGRQGLSALSVALLNHFAGNYGNAAIAAFSVVSRITQFLYSFVLGFGQGFQPICGFNYGARQFNRVYKGVWFSIKVATAFLLFVSVLTYPLAPTLISLFRNDSAVINIGTRILRAQCFAMPVWGWIAMMNMMLQNICKIVPASILAMGRQGLVLIPVLVVSSSLFGLYGLAHSQMVSDLITALIAIPLALPSLRELKRSPSLCPES